MVSEAWGNGARAVWGMGGAAATALEAWGGGAWEDLGDGVGAGAGGMSCSLWEGLRGRRRSPCTMSGCRLRGQTDADVSMAQ